MAPRVILKSDPLVAFLAQIQWAFCDEGDCRIDTKRLYAEQGSSFPFACFFLPIGKHPKGKCEGAGPTPALVSPGDFFLARFSESRKKERAVLSALSRFPYNTLWLHCFISRMNYAHSYLDPLFLSQNEAWVSGKNRTKCISIFSIRK